jgi:hypothetical protein
MPVRLTVVMRAILLALLLLAVPHATEAQQAEKVALVGVLYPGRQPL